MTAPFWSQAAGLLLFVLLVLAAVAARRFYLRVLTRRVHAAAARPVPGRTRDEVITDSRRVS